MSDHPTQSVADIIGGLPMAVDLLHGQPLLQMQIDRRPQSMPAPAVLSVGLSGQGAGAMIKIERGERFAVARGVAVMPVRGILTPNSEMLERYMGWSTYQGIEDTAAMLADDDEVGAVVLDIDSPGGLVIGIDAAAMALAALSARKPVYAIANPLAASAAYWLAVQARELSITPGGYVGSVGVMREAASPVAPDYAGRQWSVHVSSHARAKWSDAQTEEGRAQIQRDLDQAEAAFHAAVARGRGIDLADLPGVLSVTDNDADGGAVYTPAEAIARGLADHEETRAAFYGRVFATHAPKPPARSARAQGYAARAAAARAQTAL